MAHAGEDLGFDIYALEDTFLERGKPTLVKTGVAAVYVSDDEGHSPQQFGLEVRDRSSMSAKNGIEVMAGIIDAGYRGELGVVLNLAGPQQHLRPEYIEEIDQLYETINHRYTDTVRKSLRDLNPASGWTPEFLKGLSPEDISQIEAWKEIGKAGYLIRAGDKIAQLLPRQVLTSPVQIVDELPPGARGEKGFGSSGK